MEQVRQQAWEVNSSARKIRRESLQFKKKKETLTYGNSQLNFLYSEETRVIIKSTSVLTSVLYCKLLCGEAENSPLGVLIYGVSSFLSVILTAHLFCTDQESTLFPDCVFAPGFPHSLVILYVVWALSRETASP